jgi:hypothetical protein
MQVARLAEPPLALLGRALGGPRTAREKARRLWRALRAYADRPALDTRLARLRALGHFERTPSRLQLALGAADMLRFWIVPASADFYVKKGIDFRFHQVLRFLDDPASLADPIGLFSEPEVIIGHLMQVAHGNPAYDLELLESWDDGLDRLEAELDQMLAGTHPRAVSIGAIVEEPEYHARLREYVRAYRRDRRTPPPLRANIPGTPFAAVAQTFGTLHGAFRYFAQLPDDFRGALTHLITVREFRDTMVT